MKAGYEKPLIVFEEYALDVAIAAGCTKIITLGPGDNTHAVCDEYDQTASVSLDESFYETTEGGSSCTCYLTSGNSSLSTS